jgi:hypothetical protein
MKGFRAPMKRSNVNKKKKEDIIAFLEDSIKDTDESDHGNRESNKQREKADLEDMIKKKQKTENYEVALEKAREQTKHSNIEEEEYEEIEREIEKQRRKALAQTKPKHEEMLRALVEQGKKIEEHTKQGSFELMTNPNQPKGEKLEGIILMIYLKLRNYFIKQ